MLNELKDSHINRHKREVEQRRSERAYCEISVVIHKIKKVNFVVFVDLEHPSDAQEDKVDESDYEQ